MPALPCLLALDQGTTSSRSIVFDRRGRIVASAQREFAQHFPQPGWVEHDAMDLLDTQLTTARQAVAQAEAAGATLHAVGLTNQRETTVLWNRATGRPVAPAIVWQDRRTEPDCARWRAQGLEPRVQALTGLRLDPYFSASKLRWLLEHTPGARAAAERGELAFGTVDSWLLWHLSEGRVHATDESNASRTLLWNVHTRQWDPELLSLFDIPPTLLPQVKPSCADFGQTRLLGSRRAASLPLGGVAGDQAAALFGQGGWRAGLAKNTYGTGCFMLLHTGNTCATSTHGLLASPAATAPGTRGYTLEGSVFVGGAVVQWLRDGLQMIESSAQVGPLAAQVEDSGGVVLVPAFTGLGAPHWRADARGALLGLTRGTTSAHIARAALESIAFQSTEVLQAMNQDLLALNGPPLRELRVDGGACSNDLLMQFQADLLGIPVVRPQVIESTALGAAWLAGLQCGLYDSLAELDALREVDRCFEPTWSRDQADARMAGWRHAIRQVLAP